MFKLKCVSEDSKQQTFSEEKYIRFQKILNQKVF